jgi:hypothetical protein
MPGLAGQDRRIQAQSIAFVFELAGQPQKSPELVGRQ